MPIAPGAGQIELTRPETAPGIARCCLLPTVVIGRDGEPGLDNLPTQILAIDTAGGQYPPETIMPLRLAKRRPTGHESHQLVTGRAPAGPIGAAGIGASLIQFGRVDAEKANALAAKMKTVAIADPRPAGNGGVGGAQAVYQHGACGQNEDCQHGAKAAAKRSPPQEV